MQGWACAKRLCVDARVHGCARVCVCRSMCVGVCAWAVCVRLSLFACVRACVDVRR